MIILGIDTCDNTAACALCSGEDVIADFSFKAKRSHSQVILPLVTQMLEMTGYTLQDIDAFAAVSGPRSYTGLRIGISTVQGLCYGLDKPCVGVSALEALAYNYFTFRPDSAVCAVMHARADLYYFAEFVNGKRTCEDCMKSSADIYSYISSRSADMILLGDTENLELSRNCIIPPKAFSERSAVSLCRAAMTHGFTSADKLAPDYLQLVKAEKDLLDKINN